MTLARPSTPWYAVAAALMMFWLSPAVHSQQLPDTLSAADTTLVLNGQGKRKKAIISLYRAGLYLESNSADAAAIIAADEPMAIRLVILSRFISAEKMQTAMEEGFAQSTGGKVQPIRSEVDQFAGGFADEITKKDVFDLSYLPGRGVEVIKNGDSKVIVAGLEFKQALFGIWLSDQPIQGSLKSALLGG